MLLIDITPIILSASFALIGIQSSRFQETSDILEQRISLEATKIENEQYFLEALITSTSFAIVRLDTYHHVITCNKAFEDLFGYLCDEIVGMHLDDLIASDELLLKPLRFLTMCQMVIWQERSANERPKMGVWWMLKSLEYPFPLEGRI